MVLLVLPFPSRVKAKLHEMMQTDKDFTQEDEERLNPCHQISIDRALKFIKVVTLLDKNSQPLEWVFICKNPLKFRAKQSKVGLIENVDYRKTVANIFTNKSKILS